MTLPNNFSNPCIYSPINSFLIPDFLNLQRSSFQEFLKNGLMAEFRRYNPIINSAKTMEICFYADHYKLHRPKWTPKQAILKRKSYASPLYIPIQLTNLQTEEKSVQWLFIANLPLMTTHGHFILNGSPRVIMNQMIRSPGVYFKKATNTSKKAVYYADFIAQRGAWLRLEVDTKNGTIWAKLKKTPKIPVFVLLRSLGLSVPILNSFMDLIKLRYLLQLETESYKKTNLGLGPFSEKSMETPQLKKLLTGLNKVLQGRLNKKKETANKKREKAERKRIRQYIAKNRLQTKQTAKARREERQRLKNEIKRQIRFEKFERWLKLFKRLCLKRRGHFTFDSEHLLSLKLASRCGDLAKTKFSILPKKRDKDFLYLNQKQSLLELSTTLFPVIPDLLLEKNKVFIENPIKKAQKFLFRRFLNARTYDLSPLGRYRMNQKLGLDVPLQTTTLTAQDVIFTCFFLMDLLQGQRTSDDIDDLKHRKIKPAGELIQTQLGIGLSELERSMKERLEPIKDGLEQPQTFQLLLDTFGKGTAKPVQQSFREFFGTSPLSQLMDQTNPLAELTHKRRLSSLGPGGIERETAGMSIRGIHPTHYGRICPIETPEGQNAGLVNSITTYAQFNKKGFLETPFYKTYKGFILKNMDPFLFSSDQENLSVLAPGDIPFSKFHFVPENIDLPARYFNEFKRVSRKNIDFISLSPIQMISVATSLIPFLEHDDGNRALMGSNMQRQAISTLKLQKPIVGTGLESRVISDVGHNLQAKKSGFISYVDGKQIHIYSKKKERLPTLNFPKKKDLEENKKPPRSFFSKEIFQNLTLLKYDLDSFFRSNQDTYTVHRPFVKEGQWVEKGEGLADGSSSKQGELSLGQNLLVGYTPWEGYNFEDAVLISEKVVYDDLYTSLHIERYEVEVRDTAYGLEQISNNLLKYDYLDDNGIVKIGTWVTENDVLVGKMAPLSEKKFSPYQDLLYDIIGKERPKARDTSLRVPKNVRGRVIHIEILEKSDNTEILEKSDSTKAPGFFSNSLKDKNKKKERFSNESPLKTSDVSFFKNPHRLSKKNMKDRRISLFKKFCQPTSTILLKTKLQGILQKSQEKQSSGLLKRKKSKPLKPFLKPKRNVYNHDYENFFFAARQKKGRFLPWQAFQMSPISPSPPVFCPSKKSVFRRLLEKRLPPFKLSTPRFSIPQNPKKGGFSFPPFFFKGEKVGLNRYKRLTPRVVFSQGLGLGMSLLENASLYHRLPNKLSTKDGVVKSFTPPILPAANTKKRSKSSPKLGFVPSSSWSKKKTKSETRFLSPVKVHVYLAEKRKLQLGDKIAGRHGNKGIISNILPRQDMPYLPDGTPLDIVLNPLGVPSRMNVGQIFECLLGLAGYYLKQSYKIRPFDEIYGSEASRSLVYSKLYEARCRTNQSWLFNPNFPGKVRLFDGRTGDCFKQPVTVGVAYILKLVHLVDHKIHARSTGPYSLVTQQPLRGRSKQGGQRVGEMEVWALEGFGAAYILQEILTIKSDDLEGRHQILRCILRNEPMKTGIPESFKVLVRELQSLCLDIVVFKVSKYKSTRLQIEKFPENRSLGVALPPPKAKKKLLSKKESLLRSKGSF